MKNYSTKQIDMIECIYDSRFFIKDKLKNFYFLILKLILFPTFCFSVFADVALISVVTSRNGKVSYINVMPLHYEAKKKDLDPIQVSLGASIDNKKWRELRPMELIIYSACNRGDPQKEAALGFRAQFLQVNFLMSPHPDDLF